jgi:hypothetical protein
VEIANRISLEPFLRGPTAFDLRQSADADEWARPESGTPYWL